MRAITVLTSIGLLLIAGVHAGWAAGMSWPGDDRAELSKIVVGTTELPPNVMTAGIAVMLVAAAAILLARAFADFRQPLLRFAVAAGPVVVAVVLFARAALGFGQNLVGYPASVATEFRRPDLLVYSPLCTVLGIGAALTAWYGFRRVRATREARIGQVATA